MITFIFYIISKSFSVVMVEFIVLFVFILIFLFLIYPFVFKTMILKLFKRFGLFIHFEGRGFIHPFLFEAHNVHVKFEFNHEMDTFDFKCNQISFKIKILPLLIGKVHLKDLYIYKPNLFYENKLNSFLKIKILPHQKRVCIKNLNIIEGEVFVIDYLLPGPYKLKITDITIKNAKMDLATPVNLLFFIEYGEAKIDKGTIKAITHYRKDSKPEGSLILKQIKWTSAMGLEIPLIGTTFDLNVYYTHLNEQETFIKGYLYLTGNKEEQENGIPFEFVINWRDYRLPMDLSLQKLIENIFSTVQPSLIEKGIFYIGKEVFDRVKKTPI